MFFHILSQQMPIPHVTENPITVATVIPTYPHHTPVIGVPITSCCCFETTCPFQCKKRCSECGTQCKTKCLQCWAHCHDKINSCYYNCCCEDNGCQGLSIGVCGGLTMVGLSLAIDLLLCRVCHCNCCWEPWGFVPT